MLRVKSLTLLLLLGEFSASSDLQWTRTQSDTSSEPEIQLTLLEVARL